MHKFEAALLGTFVLLFLSMALAGNASASVGAISGSPDNVELIDYVNPFLGVGISTGHDYPAVCVPFGTTQWTPNCLRETGGTSVPYYGESSITGFRGSHYPSGACMRDYASVSVDPQAGALKTDSPARLAQMSDIEAHPDYFAVTLKQADNYDVRVEMTATMHVGFFRITYLGSGNAHILVDAHYAGNAQVNGDNEILAHNMQHGQGSDIEGYSIAVFNTPFLPSSAASGTMAHADYQVSTGETILVKVANSFISFDQARANLSEIPGWDFDGVRSETRATWNRELGRIEVEGGTENQKIIFYTALYHAYLTPRIFSEENHYYSPFDGNIHSSEGWNYYDDLSLWDTFRALQPLLTLIQPKVSADVCQTLVDMYEEGGWMPKWPNPGYTGVMIGTHGDSVIVDAYMKGIGDFDVEKAYEAIIKNAMEVGPAFYEARSGISYYRELGYVPADKIGESASCTIEYAYEDWAIAQFAHALGKENDYELFMARALNYKNVYDSNAPGDPFPGFVRGKNLDGSWTNPGTFDPTTWYGYITEGTPYQYLWFVPHDVQGLIDMMGGKDTFNEKLDYFFQMTPSYKAGGDRDDMNDYYWHGNEPSQHDVYLYDWSGQPWRTQELVRLVMDNYYAMPQGPNGLSGGLSGNDDCGATSAWYIFSAMGFYPVCPGQLTYQIGSPIFDRVTIHLPDYIYGGKDFVIIAEGVSSANKYIQSATLNGAPLNKPWFSHSDLASGGTLTFQMGSVPNMDWGSDPANVPPSMATVTRYVPIVVGPGVPFTVVAAVIGVVIVAVAMVGVWAWKIR